MFEENYSRQWRRLELGERGRLLDLVLIKSSDILVDHAGLMLDDLRFIHACKQGVIVTPISYLRNKRAVAGIYRFKNDSSQVCPQ